MARIGRRSPPRDTGRRGSSRAAHNGRPGRRARCRSRARHRWVAMQRLRAGLPLRSRESTSRSNRRPGMRRSPPLRHPQLRSRHAAVSRPRARRRPVARPPRDRHEHRSGLVDGPELAEPRRPEAGDLRDVRERLHVLHERRAPADAALERPRRRERWLRRTAVHEVHQRGLFTGDVARRNVHQTDRNWIETGSPARFDRTRNRRKREMGGAIDCDHDLRRTDRQRGHHRTVEHEVGEPGHQQLVLRAGRLAFGAVGDDDRTPARGYGPQLARRGKGSPAAAAQATALDHVDECVSVAAPGQGRLPVHGEVLLQGHRGIRAISSDETRERVGVPHRRGITHRGSHDQLAWPDGTELDGFPR